MKDDIIQAALKRKRQEILDLLRQTEVILSQTRVNDLRASMGLPPQPAQPVDEEDYRLPMENGGERE